MAGQRNPDLQRLLANLRESNFQLDNRQTQQEGQPANGTSFTGQGIASIPGLGFLPPEEIKSRSVTPSKPSTPQPAARPPQAEEIRGNSTTPVVPDASTIATWPAALKYVTKHVVSNQKTVSKIKHLISEQHKHERQWWAGREAIVARHSGRAGNLAKVADLLKSLGGAAVPVIAQDPHAEQAELKAYDEKVYRSLTGMTADFDRQLRALQIPFFAIKHDLVIMGDGVQKEGTVLGKLDKGELRELQKRMIETLEDLIGDD